MSIAKKILIDAIYRRAERLAPNLSGTCQNCYIHKLCSKDSRLCSTLIIEHEIKEARERRKKEESLL